MDENIQIEKYVDPSRQGTVAVYSPRLDISASSTRGRMTEIDKWRTSQCFFFRFFLSQDTEFRLSQIKDMFGYAFRFFKENSMLRDPDEPSKLMEDEGVTTILADMQSVVEDVLQRRDVMMLDYLFFSFMLTVPTMYQYFVEEEKVAVWNRQELKSFWLDYLPQACEDKLSGTFGNVNTPESTKMAAFVRSCRYELFKRMGLPVPSIDDVHRRIYEWGPQQAIAASQSLALREFRVKIEQ